MTRDEKYQAFVQDDLTNNRGRLVNCCDELDYLLAHPEANMILNKHYLNDILTHATLFSDYYKDYSNYKTLQEFPIVNKQFLKDHWDEIFVKAYQECTDN